ncbi:hypothetical protein [Streptomyces brasiliensis]|uniref:Uncharacterized protein n=1 Tax=Streptomyces brasiliensis TaxID=1954 RepID=A0A917P3N2_9ACTN|nr:hypothetical protein [Streptomyces brasiliensis]GGJ56459.1 hypothetical protein GCM10010121_078840 [Streptomyces brasiliensis]
MTTSSWDRSRRVAAAASVLTVIAVVAGAITLTLGVSLPEAWWPHTGQAFAADTRTAHHDPCATIAGPAKAYCGRGTTTTGAAQQDVAGAAWRLVPAGAGVAALVIWRRPNTATGQGRR